MATDLELVSKEVEAIKADSVALDKLRDSLNQRIDAAQARLAALKAAQV